MSVLRPTPVRFEPVSAAPLLSDLGFVASPDLPDRPGPAYLLVALRASPTLRHYDPEAVEYWVSDGGKGSRRTVTRSTRVPLESEFSWGLIRIVDRLHVTNEYLTFGGHLSVDSVDDVTVAVFASPAPMLRRGGHSQDWDEGAETLGAFFSRVLLAVDVAPGVRGSGGGGRSRLALFRVRRGCHGPLSSQPDAPDRATTPLDDAPGGGARASGEPPDGMGGRRGAPERDRTMTIVPTDRDARSAR